MMPDDEFEVVGHRVFNVAAMAAPTSSLERPGTMRPSESRMTSDAPRGSSPAAQTLRLTDDIEREGPAPTFIPVRILVRSSAVRPLTILPNERAP